MSRRTTGIETVGRFVEHEQLGLLRERHQHHRLADLAFDSALSLRAMSRLNCASSSSAQR
jgi:hypothetical protein